MPIINVLVAVLKLLTPVFLFLMGRRKAREEQVLEATKKELEDVKDARNALEGVHSASDTDLIDRVYERPDSK